MTRTRRGAARRRTPARSLGDREVPGMIGAKAPYSHKAGLKHMSLGVGDRSRTRDILITSPFHRVGRPLLASPLTPLVTWTQQVSTVDARGAGASRGRPSGLGRPRSWDLRGSRQTSGRSRWRRIRGGKSTHSRTIAWRVDRAKVQIVKGAQASIGPRRKEGSRIRTSGPDRAFRLLDACPWARLSARSAWRGSGRITTGQEAW